MMLLYLEIDTGLVPSRQGDLPFAALHEPGDLTPLSETLDFLNNLRIHRRLRRLARCREPTIVKRDLGNLKIVHRCVLTLAP